jgi:hypothetical protein
MSTPLLGPRVLPGFLSRPDVGDQTAAPGGPTTCYSKASGETTDPSGLTVPPPPPAPNAPRALTAASGGQTTQGTEAGILTATPGDQTARPFMAPSSPASPTSVMPHAASMTPPVPHAALTFMTPPTPHVALASQLYLKHYSRRP